MLAKIGHQEHHGPQTEERKKTAQGCQQAAPPRWSIACELAGGGFRQDRLAKEDRRDDEQSGRNGGYRFGQPDSDPASGRRIDWLARLPRRLQVEEEDGKVEEHDAYSQHQDEISSYEQGGIAGDFPRPESSGRAFMAFAMKSVARHYEKISASSSTLAPSLTWRSST
ncbi:hypothetical protein EN852_012340 [Mesorhizobium sp. M2E.F.Ca.ET.209.01.1.1]|uniref:hypothetical protein n=1 Tax=Mesorhizobium sp. M2E.F.Ca.ET.209.01.1.1 TaxID=2500526 RepID=UPI000FD804DE|nr:hypothetical protein [Mesorhizobium sp. M2E.F.Ca.ET.209.01.1.1]TGS15067.1 hypothetical protein EN852_012340 [Mesorhizobium sp. M2E.F.Ca.ET.209.01.1.1]